MASEGLECSICCERFDEEELCPRLLSCGHSFCSSCLEKLFIDYAIKCPTCRSAAPVPAGVTGLPKNFALLGVLQATPQTPADGNGDLRVCEVCDDEKHPATSCCLDCREDMCKDVARWHTRQKTTREHRVVSLKELKANPKLATIPLFCPEHNEQYRFFDEECNHVVCRDCVTLKHNGHKCLSLAEAASKYRQEMEALATKASAHADGIKAAEARVVALSLDLNKAYEEQTAQIKGAFKEQFYAQMGKSFKMSGKGGSVEHDGDKDPVTELKPQDSHDTGLPGATSDIEEEKCFSRLKPLDTAHWKKRLENVVTTAIDFEAKHKECVRVLPYTDDDHIKVQLYVFSGKSGVPQELKDAAQECFGGMKVKLEWFDLYNYATEILKVTSIEFPSGKPERFNESQIYEINEIINKNLHVFVKHRNVTAVQASFKIINSKQTKQPCIAIYVLGKGSIPVGEIEFPRTLGGYNVDVVDGFWFTTGEDDPWRPNEGQQQCEVLCLGASIGVEGEEGCGTLGAIVEGDGNFYALSCDHVMKRAQKPEIIHPARDDYLNYLNYHLQQYVERIQYIIKREQCFLAETISKFSFGIIKDLESLKTKFQELISLKEEHFDQDRAKKGNLEKVQLHEKALENGFKTPPRVIGWYIAGISRNMMWTDDQEYFIDAAIAQLTPKEVKGLRESETVEMIGTGKSPSGRCSSKFTAFGELCKSGRTTEYTNSGRHANPNVYLRLTSYRLNAQNEHLIDVVKRVSLCHTCANLAGVQEDLEPTFPPSCVCCTVDKKTLNDKVWWKNCLCIDRPYDPAKGDAFSAGGDSGAVIFEIEKNKSLLGFGIIFAQQCHSYGSCALASPLLPALQTLSREIPVNESLSLCSNVVGIPSDSDTGELPWGCNIG